MPEYINRDTLKQLILDDNAPWTVSVVIRHINNCPTTDVEPVRHGRWKWTGADRWNDAFECSECGKILMDDSNYCPNCGAKMDMKSYFILLGRGGN